MKGFKQAPKTFGFKTSADSKFAGKSEVGGGSSMVRPHFRAKPAFAKGGMVTKTIGDQGNALVQRSKPITQFDATAGGKGPLRTGYAKGGKIPPAKMAIRAGKLKNC